MFQEWFLTRLGQKQELLNRRIDTEISKAQGAQSHSDIDASKEHFTRARQFEQKLQQTITEEFFRQDAWRYYHSVVTAQPFQQASPFQLAPVSKRGMPGPSAKTPRSHSNAKKKHKR